MNEDDLIQNAYLAYFIGKFMGIWETAMSNPRICRDLDARGFGENDRKDLNLLLLKLGSAFYSDLQKESRLK